MSSSSTAVFDELTDENDSSGEMAASDHGEEVGTPSLIRLKQQPQLMTVYRSPANGWVLQFCDRL